MNFPSSFLDELRARIPVSTVVGRRVTWDRRKTNPGKGDYWACCPFHNEKTPSFHADDRKGIYYCFGCKASGDIFTFLTQKEGLHFGEAVRRLADEAGVPVPSLSPEDAEREEKRASLYDVMEMAARFFEAELQSARGSRARGYLADRGLPGIVQQEFQLGYAPDSRSALREHLAGKGVQLEQMIEAGLVVSGEDIPVAYDRFRDRLMFPIRDPRGRTIAFGGRALSSEAQAKYLNSPDTPLFRKGSVLYNFDQARGAAHEAGSIVAVEGYMDTIAVHRAGIRHVVAPLGTALTADQLRLLWRSAPEPILCFDGDEAGTKAAYRGLDLALPMLAPGHSLRFAFLPEGLDPDDLLKTQGPEAVRAALAAAEPMSDVLWWRSLDQNDRSTPERRARFERDLSAAVRLIEDPTVQSHYSADMAERLRALWGRGEALRPARKAPRFASQRAGRWAAQEPWRVPTPASAQLRALAKGPPARVSERRERQIVLGLLNHPELLHDFLDEFASAEFASRELDSLRRRIIDACAAQDGLDGPGLRDHLTMEGFLPLIERIEALAGRLNEWFLDAGAASADARTGLSQMFALNRRSMTLERELKAAEERLATDPTEENLQALDAVRTELETHLGIEAAIDGFGAQSGRPQSAIG
jgi:DNA primase